MLRDPLGDILLVLGSAAAGAALHKVATDHVHQYQLQRAFEQGRIYERQLALTEIQALRAEIREAKAVAQQLHGQQLKNDMKAIRQALPPGGWASLWDGNGNGNKP